MKLIIQTSLTILVLVSAYTLSDYVDVVTEQYQQYNIAGVAYWYTCFLLFTASLVGVTAIWFEKPTKHIKELIEYFGAIALVVGGTISIICGFVYGSPIIGIVVLVVVVVSVIKCFIDGDEILNRIL